MEIKNLKKRKEVKQVESPIERKLLAWLHQYGIFPELQYEIPPYRVDFAIPSMNLVIECDGAEFHSTDEQRQRDQKRDKFLNNKGWTVKRFTGSKIYNEPYNIAKEIIELWYPRKIELSEGDKEVEFMKLKTDTINNYELQKM